MNCDDTADGWFELKGQLEIRRTLTRLFSDYCLHKSVYCLHTSIIIRYVVTGLQLISNKRSKELINLVTNDHTDKQSRHKISVWTIT